MYDVQQLKKGNTQSAFEMATNGMAVRALVPNPAPENGHIAAVMLEEGQLLLANFKDRQFQSSKQGHIIKDAVSCVSWSTKGKQLMAGMVDGTCVQMDPTGDEKARIPRPPTLNSDYHGKSSLAMLSLDYIDHFCQCLRYRGKRTTQYMLFTPQ